MAREHTNDDDLVRIRPHNPATRPIQIDLDASPPSHLPSATPPESNNEAPNDFEVVLRSAALLSGDKRIPIPKDGLTLGSSEDATLQIPTSGVAQIQAVIEVTADGHVIVERAAPSKTFVNGEKLVAGERRPLRRGDSIALAGQLLHYLPSGRELPQLAPIQPVDAGRVRTNKQEFTVGRDPTCDLVLDHPTVSRHHAVISMGNGTPTIEDHGSTVGVRVNGELIRRAPLHVGDQIAIGPYRIVFDGEELFEREASAGLAVVAAQVRVDVESGTILQPTNLHLGAGELVAIIGESGAGKSTLLRALAGVSQPSNGRVLIGGETVGERLCELGYVPQFDIVHDQLTVGEALDYAARLRLPPDTLDSERVSRVREVIDQLGLTDRTDVRVALLSGGQRKRVAVGVELLHRPGALFLDEPTTGLDPGLERHMTQLFRTLADTGQTVTLVTHATGSIALCDRVIVMGRGGYLRFDGHPDELLRAFQVEHFDDVYAALADQRGPQPVESSRMLRERPPVPLPPLRGHQPVSRPVQQTLQYQTRVLASRYAVLVLRDRRHLRSALIQVPILGLLTALLFVSNVFEKAPVPHYAAKSAQLIFLMVTIAVWLGSINAAREIVKERNVLDRELSVGVQIPAYLASKLIVLLTLAAAQTLLFSLIVLSLRPLHETSFATVELVGILIVTSWVAVLLGLVVSAYASSEDQATGVIPLLLVPQLLFSGAIVPVHGMTTPVKLLSLLIPARWSFATSGNVIHMQERINADPAFGQVSQYGQNFFSVGAVPFLIICALFAAALFTGVVRLLQRRNV